uniref:Sprouty-related, EVH1 domain-containing protein 2 n=1 Tax=Tetraodon nigroviridis TaxID=99883 RepID=H3CWT4_TETNG
MSHLSLTSDSYIVRVKAVVMTRDDSTGGWLAQDGGALTRVGVCRLLPPELAPVPASSLCQFLIRGERLRDKQVILDCPLRKDLVYTVANPTFHHWKVEDRKCGLSFQSPADARAFDRGVRKAIDDLAEGSTTSSTALQNEGELGDDDVFTETRHPEQWAGSRGHFLYPSTSVSADDPRASLSSSTVEKRKFVGLNLAMKIYFKAQGLSDPVMRPRSPVSSQAYSALQAVWCSALLKDTSAGGQPLPRLSRHVTFQEDEEIVRINPRERRLTGYEDYRHTNVRDKFIQADDSGSYVKFGKPDASKHDYTYHQGVSSVVSSQPRSFLPSSSPSTNGGKARRKGGAERAQCEHCGEAFYIADNRRGRCQDAPDPVRACIRRVSCMWLADTMLYHCMSDPEGDYLDPCSCDGGEGGGGGRLGTRWLALLGLSVVAPCLCLYPPLHACHQGGLRCGCCGGRHKALR